MSNVRDIIIVIFAKIQINLTNITANMRARVVKVIRTCLAAHAAAIHATT